MQTSSTQDEPSHRGLKQGFALKTLKSYQSSAYTFNDPTRQLIWSVAHSIWIERRVTNVKFIVFLSYN